MAQQHLDRLTSTDAGFLHQEGPNSHMHIGGVLVFEGPAPALEELLDHIRSRLHLIPRYRQKLAHPPLEAGRPVWIDDTSFNLEYHVRHAALPAPGSFEQLMQAAARIASQRLDRNKPLWEFWLIEGLEPAAGSDVERFAMISKTHHSLIDGIAGMDIVGALFDLAAAPAPVAPEGLKPWTPSPEPTPLELMLAGIRGAVNTAAEIGSRALAAAVQPSNSVEALRDAAEGVGEILWAILNPAPETPLNVPIGPHRRFAVVRQQLDDYKAIKNHFDCTVNDVVLAVVAGGLARWLRSRGLRTDGVELRALVPVSVRSAAEQGALGNRLALMRAPLPLYVEDSVARLGVVSREMDRLKASKQAQGALTIAAVNDVAPPAVLAQVSKLQFSSRLFNLLVTNVPGPQVPLYIVGRELQDLYPLAFLPENQALAVAITSYNGRVEYGLLADFDALPDVQVIVDGIEAELAALLAAASVVESGARGSARGLFGSGGPGSGGPDRSSRNGHEAQQPRPILPQTRRRSTAGPAAEMRASKRAAANGKRRTAKRRDPAEEQS